MMGIEAKTKTAALALLVCAAAVLAMAGAGDAAAAAADGTAVAAAAGTAPWQRVEDAAAEWELPVDAELRRRIGAVAGGELLYAGTISPGAMWPDRPVCPNGHCSEPGGGYHGRGCIHRFGCH